MESKKWSTGYTLMTSSTKRWSKEEIDRNDAVEGKIIFESFTPEDHGKSRKRIAFCETNEDAAHIVKCVNERDEIVKVLDMVTRIFIYSSGSEFSVKEKILATELAVKALLNCGISTIGETFENTNKETLSPTLQKKYDQLWNK